MDEQAELELERAENPERGYTGKPTRTLASALLSITIADVSTSLDNVLAVAAIPDGDTNVLIFGLALSCYSTWQARCSTAASLTPPPALAR